MNDMSVISEPRVYRHVVRNLYIVIGIIKLAISLTFIIGISYLCFCYICLFKYSKNKIKVKIKIKI